MKKILILFGVLLIFLQANAQTGADCSNAIAFPNTNSCINNNTITGSELWFSFVATASTQSITLKLNSTSSGHIHTMELIGGVCYSGLSKIDSINITNTNDTILELHENALVIGNTYYVRARKDNLGCPKCQIAANFNLCLSPFLVELLQICGPTGCCLHAPCTVATICLGSSVTLTSFLSSGATYTSNWTFGGGGGLPSSVTTSGPTITITPTATGTYTVSVMSLTYAGTYAGSETFQIIVINNPIPPPTFTINPNPSCVGQQVCMTNTTASPYDSPFYSAWNFGDGNTAGPGCTFPTCSCNTYTTSGTYTVTLTVADPALVCPSQSATGTLTVQDPSISISAGTVCLGATTTFNLALTCLTPADITSYNWSFGDGTTSTLPNPTHVYPSAGTFNVTLTVNGGSYTAICTAVVSPLPPVPLISSPIPNVICSPGTSVTYTITNFTPPASSYSVSITSGIGSVSPVNSSGQFTIIWGSTTGGQAVITVTDQKGCQNFAVLDILPCCTPSSPTIHNFVNTNSTSLIAFYGTGTTVVSKTFYINGTFTIDQDLTLEGCNVSLGPDAKVIYTGSHIFRIADNSILKAGCGQMWDGIYVPNNTNVVQVKSSIVQDAKNAIVSNNGGIYDISNSTLNKNYKSIVVNAYSLPHISGIGGSTISCVASATSPGTLLLPPYSTERSPVGIEINDVTNASPINIGSSGGLTGRVTFDNLDVAILSTRSNVSVKFCDFKNIQTIPGQIATAAIYAKGKPFLPLPLAVYHLTVGGYGTGEGNTFSNCIVGVYSILNMNVNVYKNDMNLTTNYGVHCQNSGFLNTINIKDNTIKNARVAIHCFSNTSCTTEIFLNKISVSAFMASLYGNTYGILLQELSSATTTSHYNVFDNKIQNVRNGIRADNLYKAILDNNKIELKPTSSSTTPATGIELNANNITQVTASDIQSIPASSALWVGGIHANMSPNSYIGCNVVLKNMGYGIQCSGAMHASTVFNNSMTGDTRGIWLSNGGIIDQQGNATSPTYNKWMGSFTDKAYSSVGTNGGLSKFYILNSPATYDFSLSTHNDGTGTSVAYGFATGSSTAPPCTIFPPPALIAGGGLRQQVAQNLVSFATPEAKWLSKRSVYTELLNDSTLLANPVLNGFKDSIDFSAMGKLTKVKKALGNAALASSLTDLTNAVNDNNTVMPSIQMETESKTVNSILLGNLQIGQDYFDAGQLATLHTIASECPFTFGDAVYEARMLLQPYDSIGTVYLSTCEMEASNHSMLSFNNQQLPSDLSFNLYPNPNNGFMTLTYQMNTIDKGTIMIFDLTGRKLIEKSLDPESNSMIVEANTLSNGVYLYQVFINGKAIKTDRIVIVK